MKRLSTLILLYALISFLVLYFLQNDPDIFILWVIGAKWLLFVIIPALYLSRQKKLSFLDRKKLDKTSLKRALSICVILFAVVWGGYLILQQFIDLQSIADDLQKDIGMTPERFVPMSFYITFGNSFVEEFFFRGVLYLFLGSLIAPRIAFWISALFFAGYHVVIFDGWFTPLVLTVSLVGLTLGGVFFNLLNRKSQTIYPGWIAHAGADIAIMIVGYKMFGFF